MQDSGLNPGLYSWEASAHQPNHTPSIFWYSYSLLHGNIFLLWILFIALEITDPFSFQTLDKYFNLHILVFMLIFKCISLIWICCRLSTDISGTPVFCRAPTKPVWVQCWAMNSRVHPLLRPWLSLSLTYIRLVVGLTLDFPHLYCLPLDGGNLAFVSQRCFLFLWPGHAKSLTSLLDLWTLPFSKKSGHSALVSGHSSAGRTPSSRFA